MTKFIVTQEQIDQITQDKSEFFDLAVGDLKKILIDIAKRVDVEAAKKITSKAILKQRIREYNQPIIAKFINGEIDNKELNKMYDIFPVEHVKGTQGKYRTELMTFKDAKKKAITSVYAGYQKSSQARARASISVADIKMLALSV